MKVLSAGWNFMRIIRLVLGVAVFIQGIVSKDVLTIITGFIFGGMALANVGCCGENSCAVNTSPLKNQNSQIEELDNKK